MTKQLTLISPETYLSSTWSGGGTTQLCLLPAGASYAERNFDLRISSATVEIEESVFSDLRGYSRIIAPLEGSFDLQHLDRKGLQHFHLKRYQLHAFDGGEKTLCWGRGRDFNVIFRHGLDVKVMRLDPGEEPLALDLSAAALAGAGDTWAESVSSAALTESGATLAKPGVAGAALAAAGSAGAVLEKSGATGTDLTVSKAKKIYLFFPKATSFEVEGEAGKAPALTLWQFMSQECEEKGIKLSAPAYLIMMSACKDE